MVVENYRKKTIITVIALCMLSCVYDRVERIQAVNHSNEGQIVYYSCTDVMGTEIDSFRNRYYEQTAGYKSSIVNENVYIDKKSSKWFGTFFKRETIARSCEDKHIRFFFISDSVFTNNPWDTIVKYQMYNRKLVFSEEDLKKSNWTVIYE